MPGIYDTPMSRKKFLAASAGMAGAFSPLARRASALQEIAPARLALLSDTHIPKVASDGYRGFVPADNLKQVVQQVTSVPGQAAIINGDAARLVGEQDDYVVLKELLQPVAEKMPVHIGLGNHDDRQNFFKVFPQDAEQTGLVKGKHVSSFALAGTRFVVLDSLLYVNKVAGLIGKAQREWIEGFLQDPDERPIVFFVHHTLGDGDGDLLDFDRVFHTAAATQKSQSDFLRALPRLQCRTT